MLPLALLVYLAFMAYMGRSLFTGGEYLHYFGVIGVSLIIIALLYVVLRKREKMRVERDKKLFSTYKDKTDDKNEDDVEKSVDTGK